MSFSFSDSVWDRSSGDNTMSKNLFAFLVAGYTALGIGASAVVAYHSQDVQLNWITAIGALIIAIIGVFIALGSDIPLFSLIGYAMVCIPFGYITGPVVALYTTASVFKVLMITTSIVVILGLVGTIIPESLESWGSYLLGGLLLLLLGSFIVPLAGFFGIPISGAMTFMDWIGVVLFSAYVVFDMNRAMHVDRTHDNAIDCALAVYLDFANLFIRLLQLMGQSSSSSSRD